MWNVQFQKQQLIIVPSIPFLHKIASESLHSCGLFVCKLLDLIFIYLPVNRPQFDF